MSSRGSARSLTSLYDRDKDWKQRREARSREAKKARADAEMLECTFSPSTNRVQVATGRQIVAKVKIKLRAAAYVHAHMPRMVWCTCTGGLSRAPVSGTPRAALTSSACSGTTTETTAALWTSRSSGLPCDVTPRWPNATCRTRS